MNPFTLLFDFRGRINRAKFWLAALIYLLFFFSVIAITMLVSDSLSALFYGALIAYVPMVISGTAVGIKRLHDRNKSGWWLALFYAGPLLLNAVSYYFFGEDESGLAQQVLVGASFVINIWALVELGCLRGTIGANQYGGDPLAPQPAPPRTLR